MPNGLDHVVDTVAMCQNVREALAGVAELDAGWQADVQARLDGAIDTLTAMQERFLLRSRLCLPFAARCVQHATALEQALQKLEAEPGATEAAMRALSDLEQAIRVLDDRSGAQGMTIT